MISRTSATVCEALARAFSAPSDTTLRRYASSPLMASIRSRMGGYGLDNVLGELLLQVAVTYLAPGVLLP